MSIFANDIVFMVLFGVIVFALSMVWADRIINWLYDKSLGSRQYVIEKLESMFVEVDRKKVTITMLLMSFGLGILFFLLLLPNVLLGFFVAAIVTYGGWQVPKFVVDALFEKRCSQFGAQMVEGLTIMANGIRSGLSVPQSMERITDNMPSPIKQEFALVLSQIKLGLSVEEALIGLGNRIPIQDVAMFVTAINILKETGGNMAETFSTMVETLRERQKIQKKIEALTAQGVTQGVIITCVPFLLLLVFLVIDPGFVKPLFTTVWGIIMLIVMLFLQLMGGLMIRKIVRIKV